MIKNTSSMNVYEMYVNNGEKAGFYIQRETWGNTIACVTTVGGCSTGPLSGKPPYFERQEVLAIFFNLHTGEYLNESPVSSPGTYAYHLVGAASLPPWARTRGEP